MHGAATEIAGGFVPVALATNDTTPNTFGGKATRTGTGVTRVELDRTIDQAKTRVLITFYNGGTFSWIYDIDWISASVFVIQTYQLGVVAGPVFSETPTNVAFSYSVSTLPE
jgi:hypothetical protein